MKDEEKKEFKKKEFRGKGKGRKPKFNDESKKVQKLCMNDPMWYVLHPDLLKDAASLPFSQFFGKGFPLDYVGTNKAGESIIFKLSYLYTLGVTNDSTDPVNLAIRNLYTYVRHQNSGHTNYESADLGLYLLATAAVVATLAHIERCIGVAKYYQRRSSVVPAALLNALGVNNVNTFVANLANYTLKLNVLWSRVSSLCIPKDFSFLKRWVWMNSQVFKDHESDKAALYVFKPVGVPQFRPITLDAGSIVQPIRESATPTIDDWYNQADAALSAILNDEDMNIMSGDILKAYGAENLLQFGMTPIDYVVEPVFVEEMLPQIQHAQTPWARATGNGLSVAEIHTGVSFDVAAKINDQTNKIYSIAGSDPDQFWIYQWDGEIICQPVPTGIGTTSPEIDTATGALSWDHGTAGDNSSYFNKTARVLTSYKEAVPPEDVMIASRLMTVASDDDRTSYASGHLVFYNSCGSELITKFTVYVRQYNNGVTYDFDGSFQVVFDTTNASAVMDVVRYENFISQLDWHPLTYFNSIDSANVIHPNAYLTGDIDNFTIISPDVVIGLNLTALLAEFSVTQYNLIKN